MADVVIPVEYLRHFELPGICARTGVPTESSYPKATYRSWWWLVFSWTSWFTWLIAHLGWDAVTIPVPLHRARRIRRLACGWLAALAFCPALVLGVGALLDPAPALVALALLAVGVFVAFFTAYATAGARVRRSGDTVWLRAHPALAEALRAQLAEPVAWAS